MSDKEKKQDIPTSFKTFQEADEWHRKQSKANRIARNKEVEEASEDKAKAKAKRGND